MRTLTARILFSLLFFLFSSCGGDSTDSSDLSLNNGAIQGDWALARQSLSYQNSDFIEVDFSDSYSFTVASNASFVNSENYQISQLDIVTNLDTDLDANASTELIQLLEEIICQKTCFFNNSVLSTYSLSLSNSQLIAEIHSENYTMKLIFDRL